MSDVIKRDEIADVPAFMQSDRDMGVKELQEYIRPPRVKVVQPQSGEPFKPTFSDGDTILVPIMQPIAPMSLDSNNKPTQVGTPFCFVPVFFFPEWCLVNPIQMRGTLPMIRARSFDPQSEIAVRSRDESTREVPLPENPQLRMRYQEHLNFIIMLLKGDAAGVPVILSFARAEHASGRNLSTLIGMRRNVPIFGCIFEATARYRKNQKGQWYGLDITNPSVRSGFSGHVTDEKQYQALKALHLRMKELHARNSIIVDHDDDDLGATNAPPM